MMGDVINLLHQLERSGIFGSIEIKMECGQVVLVRKTETIKPAEGHRRNNQGQLNEQIRTIS